MAEIKTYITELIKDLNSDKLDNQHGSYYLDWTNFTNIPSNLTNISETIDDKVYSLFVAGTNVQFTYNDEANTFTVNAVHTHPSNEITDFSESVDDRVYSLLVAGTNITISYNDEPGNLLTINANNLSSGIADFGEAVDDRVYSLLTTGSHLTFTYTDNNSSAGNLNLTTDATASDNANTIVARDSSNSFDITALDFTAQGVSPSVLPAERRLLWNNEDGTLQFGLKDGVLNLNIGQEQLARINNTTGTTLNKGQIVYVTGAQGQRLTVSLALANSDNTSARTIGVVAESISAGQEGFIATQGLLRNLSTYVDGSSEGKAIWVSPTTAGAWTTTKPSAPNHMVLVGWIVREHASSGSIFVHVQNGYELEELHDVKIVSPQHSDILTYDSAGYYWKNVSFSETLDDRVYSLFVAGTNVQMSYDDNANAFTINAVHTHPSSAITDFSEAVDDRVYSLFVAGTNVQLTYDDNANTFTVNAVHTHTSAAITDFASAVDTEAYSYLVTGTRVAQFVHTHVTSDVTDFSEAVDDRVYSLFVAGTNVQLTYDDNANTFTVNAVHTHTSAAITDFSEAVDDEVYSLLVAGTNITLNYNDAGNTLTINASTNATTLNNQAASYYLDTSSTAQTKTGDLTVAKALSSDTAGANAGAPSFSFSNDTDTGIYSSAANTLNFSAGNSNRLTISNTAFTIAASTTISAGSNRITGVADPVSSQDAATYSWVRDQNYVQRFTATIGNGSATSFTITHNLNSRDVITTVYENNSPYAVVIPDVENTTLNTITVRFAAAPTSNQYRAVVIG